MATHLYTGPGSVDVVTFSSCGHVHPKGFPTQHRRDDHDETVGVLYRNRPPLQWRCREVVVDGGTAFVSETSGAWALHDPMLDEEAE